MAKDNNHFLAGAIIGGVIGGLTVLALSPKTGKEFRQTVFEQVTALKDKAPQQPKESTFENEKEPPVSKGIQLNAYKPNQKEKNSELEQTVDKMIDDATAGQNQSINIEKMLADTEQALTDAEGKYSKQ